MGSKTFLSEGLHPRGYCNTVVRPSDDLSLVFTSVQEVKSDQYRVSYYETAELNGSDSSGSRGQ